MGKTFGHRTPALRSLCALALGIGLAAPAAQADTIVDIAAADARFSTLVAAVSAAGLVETLSGPGPFTVYAPVNEAFARLPAGTVETLLQPENRAQLTGVLLYHVDDRKLSANMIPLGSSTFRPVLDGARLCITRGPGGVSIADGSGETAMVILADIEAENGVIHVIDKVLLPGPRPACH